MESDAKKTINDNLSYITRDLPKFSSLHGLTSGVIMGTAKNIQNPLERVQAYHHIRKRLKDAIPILVASASELLGVITQTQFDVSTTKQAMDEHDQKARARAASEAAASARVTAPAADCRSGQAAQDAASDAQGCRWTVTQRYWERRTVSHRDARTERLTGRMNRCVMWSRQQTESAEIISTHDRPKP